MVLPQISNLTHDYPYTGALQPNERFRAYPALNVQYDYKVHCKAKKNSELRTVIGYLRNLVRVKAKNKGQRRDGI